MSLDPYFSASLLAQAVFVLSLAILFKAWFSAQIILEFMGEVVSQSMMLGAQSAQLVEYGINRGVHYARLIALVVSRIAEGSVSWLIQAVGDIVREAGVEA